MATKFGKVKRRPKWRGGPNAGRPGGGLWFLESRRRRRRPEARRNQRVPFEREAYGTLWKERRRREAAQRAALHR